MPNEKSKKNNKVKVHNDPSFERTRENAAEFTSAGKATRLVKNAFISLIKSAATSHNLVARMQVEMMKVVKSDSISDRGKRLVSKGDFSMLRGFEFNNKSSLDAIFYPKFTLSPDRATGKLTIQFPPLIPTRELSAPIAATHFRLVASAAELDIEKEVSTVHETRTETLPLQNLETTIPNLENQLTANTQKALMWVLCVEFFQQVNGKMYLLKNDKQNPLKVIHAESAVA